MESVVVTGANRGIGLEFVRQLVNLANPPRYVFATYRNRNTVQALKAIRDTSNKTAVLLIKMDITNTSEVEAARKIVEDIVGEKGLNLLISNAGMLKMENFFSITEENLSSHFLTNTVGPVLLLKEMLPLLEKAAACQKQGMSVSRAAVLNISSSGGSITELGDNQPPEFLSAFGYRISKAALNMAMRIIALEVKDKGILVVNMCPGWVKTDMGTERAVLSVEESITEMLNTLPLLNETHHGSFVRRHGKTIPF